MTDYMLINEELLEYSGPHGTRAACHLLWYGSGSGPLVCLVGNFDSDLGSSTTNAIEVIATTVAQRVGRDDFRLIEWYPHDDDRRFSEVTLSVAPPSAIEHGHLIAAGGDEAQTVKRYKTTVRFKAPQWSQLTEDDLARLLGEDAVRELRSFAGLPGDY